MEPLDGNAIAGPLMAHYGSEMTVAFGTCRHCGAGSRIAELQVYANAPGSVVRCRACGNVVIVIVDRRDELRVELTAFSLLAPD